MSDDGQFQIQTLEDIYALIDENRSGAARAAHAKFHSDVGTAIATIVNIGTVAGARVQADSRVAAARVLINAEIAATRLLAEAEMQASKCAEEVLAKPKEEVEAALLEIGRLTTWRLAANARESVEAIQKDAEFAINVLKETGANAIREIQTFAANATAKTRHEAEEAAKRLKAYRGDAHSTSDATSEANDAAQLIIKAAEEASLYLKGSLDAALGQINAVTDEACLAVKEAASAAEKRIAQGQERAVARLKAAIRSHIKR